MDGRRSAVPATLWPVALASRLVFVMVTRATITDNETLRTDFAPFTVSNDTFNRRSRLSGSKRESSTRDIRRSSSRLEVSAPYNTVRGFILVRSTTNVADFNV